MYFKFGFKEQKIADMLRKQSNIKNGHDCKKIIKELDEASLAGEYSRTVKLNVNQAHFLESVGLNVSPVDGRFRYYEISWKNEK